MVRKMAYIGSAYLIGLFFASFFGVTVNLLTAIAVLLFGIFMLAARRSIRAAVCAFSAAAAILLYSFYDAEVYRNIIKYDGYDVEIKGKITEISDYDGDNSAYTIRGEINGDVIANVNCFADTLPVEVGDNIKILGKVKLLKDSYKFPTKSYYKSKEIFLSVSKFYKINYENNDSFSVKKAILKYRDYIVGIIENGMDDRAAGIMSGMLFGDKSGIDSTEKTLMLRSGIGHIMSVSGVHLSVICSFFWVILSRIPMNKFLRFGLLMIPVLCFVVLAGMAVSVIRSAVMIVLVYGSELFRRRADTFNSLGIAVIALTLPSPFIVRDASFLLSVIGVFGIGVVAPKIIRDIENTRKIGKLAKSLVSSLCVMIIAFPVTTLFFDEVSVISPISNLILLPICEAILVGGVIVTVTGGIAPIANPVLWLCGIGCNVVADISEFIGSLRFAYIPLGDEYISLAVAAVLAAGLTAVVMCRNKLHSALTAAALFTALICFMSVRKTIPTDDITVAVIKENNAVSVVVHDNLSADIIDLNDGGQTSDSTMKYLNRQGIYRIDALIINEDAAAAIQIYNELFGIFDIYSYAIPENQKAFSDDMVNNMLFYGIPSKIESEAYSVMFNTDGTVALKINGAEILFCNSGNEIQTADNYNAAVLYKGTKFKNEVSADIYAFMNSKSDIGMYADKTAYAGESVVFKINENGEISSEILM